MTPTPEQRAALVAADLPAEIRMVLARLATVTDHRLPKVYGEEDEQRPKVVRYLIWCDLWEVVKWLMGEVR